MYLISIIYFKGLYPQQPVLLLIVSESKQVYLSPFVLAYTQAHTHPAAPSLTTAQL